MSYNFNNVASRMKSTPRWLLHRDKRPFYVDGTARRGQLGGELDSSRLATFDNAIAALESGIFSGLGFALGPDGTGNYWQGIDLDKVVANGLGDLADTLPGYVELSPSDLGVHAIGYGARFPALGSNGTGIEAYCEGRFFTVTGKALRCSL